MKDNFKFLLDKTYEIEGLLLRALDQEEIPQPLADLIDTKFKELRELRGGKDDPVQPVAEPAAATPVAEPTEEEADVMPQFYSLDEDDDEEAIEEEEMEIVEEEPRDSRMVSEEVKASDKPGVKFSLNDKFLFIRELFDGDKAAFDKAVESLSAFPTSDEAEEYFASELGMSLENETAARFFSLVRSV